MEAEPKPPASKLDSRARDAPIVNLAATLERLRSDPSWTTEEILEVEAGVRRILANLLDWDEDCP